MKINQTSVLKLSMEINASTSYKGIQITIALLLLYFVTISAQSSNTDSLVRAYNGPSNDSSKVTTLISLCNKLHNTNSPDLSNYLTKLEGYVKKNIPITLKAEAFKTLGDCYVEKDLVKATSNYETALKIYESISNENGKKGYAAALSGYGTIFHTNGDFERALKLYLKADSILSVYHDVNSLIKLYSKISDLYDRLNQLDKSYLYYIKIIKLAEKTDDPTSKVSAYISYANSVVDSGKYDIAETYLLKALKLSNTNNYMVGVSTAYYNLGYLESRRKNYKKALVYNKKVLEIADQMQNHYDECDALNKIGRNNFFLGDYKTAQSALDKGITIARKYEYKELLRKLLDVAVNVEGALGNYKRALDYREEYTNLYLETVDMKVQHQVNFLDAKYQAQKREGEIRQLEVDKKIKDLQISKRQQLIYGLISIIGLLLIIATVVLYNYRNKKKIAEQNNTLKEQRISQLEKEQQLLATQSVLLGEETERSRLSRDLHDGLGGLLSGIKLTLSNMKGNVVLSSESHNLYEKALGMLDSSIQELRRVAHNMMPEALVKFGLKEALSDFCHSITNKQIDINFQHFGLENRFDAKIEISMYRIAQELINNAFKHSHATTLLVQLIQEEGRINLSVQDNGKGFDTAILKTSKGAGIANIRSRVESLQGIFDLVSEPDKGTEVTVEFRLNKSVQ